MEKQLWRPPGGTGVEVEVAASCQLGGKTRGAAGRGEGRLQAAEHCKQKGPKDTEALSLLQGWGISGVLMGSSPLPVSVGQFEPRWGG